MPPRAFLCCVVCECTGLVASASAFAPAGPTPGLRRAGATQATAARRPSIVAMKAAWDPAVDKDFLIAPSILSADFAKLGQEVDNVLEAGADVVHFDVMDNHYVPNLTIGPGVCKALRECLVSCHPSHFLPSPSQNQWLLVLRASRTSCGRCRRNGRPACISRHHACLQGERGREVLFTIEIAEEECPRCARTHRPLARGRAVMPVKERHGSWRS
jgi:hypothetical protein